MRLWSLHPVYLDRAGLIAAWREALLAQAVLAGKTRGYRAHPQLFRFKETCEPMAAISRYLHELHREASHRGYTFDQTRIMTLPSRSRLIVTTGQLLHEWRHLRHKLEQRAPDLLSRWKAIKLPDAHPLFRVVEGDVATWERSIAQAGRRG